MPKAKTPKVVKVITEVTLGDYDFQCNKCKKIHHKSAYCIAQQAMSHQLTFTCAYGHTMDVP